ncbi:MAG: hypothetical protein LBT66_03775 [Methanobrevibacter sp.]|jgi:predicted outer membrane repeat protein|nr:hypothetical protein [Candidatus Methanovirga meridionalis]
MKFVKSIFGFCLIIILICGNGQFLYALENNTTSEDDSNDFSHDINNAKDKLVNTLNNTRNSLNRMAEVTYGLIDGSTIIVGSNQTYTNLKDAINHSKSGDTILLIPGNYSGEGNTNIIIDHDLNIGALVPSKVWVTYNNTDYSYEDFNKLTESSDDPDSIKNESIEHVENATTLDGGDSANIFNISENTNLNLEGFYITNCTNLKGGAINNRGNLTINDAYFVGNKVVDDNIWDREDGGGGAIYNEGNLDLNLVNFKFNEALDYASGGAIYNKGTINTMYRCMFSANYATGGGGAIYNKNKIVSSTKNMFVTNVADSEISHGGGAILDEGKDIINYKGNVFSFNIAQSGGGGAVDSYSNGANFENTSFIFNNAKTYGGAVRLLGGKSLNLENCTFNYNSVEHEGGSVYYTGDYFNSNSCNYTGNVADNDGGGLYLQSYENQFNNNSFTMNVGDNGGAIYHNGGTLNLNNNILLFNMANKTTSNGAGIYTKNGIFNINNNTFERNTAYGSGGAIYNQNSKGTIDYCVLNENICKNNGAALYNNYFNVSLLNSSVFNNYALGNGGAIYNDNYGTNFLVKQSLFENNTANKNGGSIYNTADSFFTYFSGFELNRAGLGTGKGSGGAIYNDANNVILSVSDFGLNYAEDSGGAIYNNGILSTDALNITYNAAAGYGGGLYDESNTWGAKDTKFSFNEAGKSGDDYYSADDKIPNIVGCIIGLALVLIVITILVVVVPEATGLYGLVAVAAGHFGLSAGVGTALLYITQVVFIAIGVGIFMAIEDAISSACPEFEEWGSKYWYVLTIIFIICAVGTSLLTGYVAGIALASSNIATSLEEGVKFVETWLQAGGIVSRALGWIFRGVGWAFMYLHVDDWVIGIVECIKSQKE